MVRPEPSWSDWYCRHASRNWGRVCETSGNPPDVLRAIFERHKLEPTGDPGLQNAIERLALSPSRVGDLLWSPPFHDSWAHDPSYGHRGELTGITYHILRPTCVTSSTLQIGPCSRTSRSTEGTEACIMGDVNSCDPRFSPTLPLPSQSNSKHSRERFEFFQTDGHRRRTRG